MRTWLHRVGGERGAALVETAFVLPIMAASLPLSASSTPMLARHLKGCSPVPFDW